MFTNNAFSSIKFEKRFMFEYENLVDTETGDPNASNIDKLRYIFTSKGFSLDDPRIDYIFKIVNEIESQDKDINFVMFRDLIKPCYTFFRQICQNQLAIQDVDSFRAKTEKLFNKVKEMKTGGFIPTYIPQLKEVDEAGFAVSICSVEGQRFNFGDSDSYSCMHHITSVVSYLIALEQHGQDVVSSYIGTEPSGKDFDSLELKDGIPHNPLISSGILTSCSLLYQDETNDRKYEKYARYVQQLIGGKKVDFNNEMYLSEITRCDRNY